MCEMMSKGLKEALTVLIVTHVTHVERVKRLCYVETRDKHIFAHNFLNNQPIFDPSNAMYVEGVESYFDFQPLRHALTYIALNRMVGKV